MAGPESPGGRADSPRGAGGEDEEPLTKEASTYITDPQAERLCQTFAEGLDSGLGYARIFELMKQSGIKTSIVERLRTAILEYGDRLGEAFTRFGILDPVARRLVLVAEDQGKLPQTFGQLSDLYENRYERRKQLIFGLVRPLLLIGIAWFYLGELFSGDTLLELAQSPNAGAKGLEVFAGATLNAGLYGLVCGGILYAWLKVPVDFRLRELSANIWKRLPIVSKPALTRSYALFCRFLEQSISSGLNVHEGLDLAADGANNPKLRGEIPKAQEAIEGGATLADALFQVESLPDEIIQHVDIGEESGRLDERLDFLAKRFNDRADEQFDKLMEGLIGTLQLVIIVAVVIGGFVMVLQLMSTQLGGALGTG